jgi:hypothetical protein
MSAYPCEIAVSHAEVRRCEGFTNVIVWRYRRSAITVNEFSNLPTRPDMTLG